MKVETKSIPEGQRVPWRRAYDVNPLWTALRGLPYNQYLEVTEFQNKNEGYQAASRIGNYRHEAKKLGFRIRTRVITSNGTTILIVGKEKLDE